MNVLVTSDHSFIQGHSSLPLKFGWLLFHPSYVIKSGGEHLYICSERDVSCFVLVSWEPKHCIFGTQFYLKNATTVRFQVFFHFHARKHYVFYHNWSKAETEIKKISCESAYSRYKYNIILQFFMRHTHIWLLIIS